METRQTVCNSLEEVRENIDRLDNQIIRLIAQRSSYVTQATQFKKSVAEVNAPNRYAAIIEKVKQKAEENNLNPLIAEKIYRTMINSFIEEETATFSHLYHKVKQSYY